MDSIEQFLRKAGQLALARQKSLTIETKADQTLVTNADLEISQFLTGQLTSVFNLPVLSEENYDLNLCESSDQAFVLDPIDGTVSFSKQESGWCILLAEVQINKSSDSWIPQTLKSWIYFPQEDNFYFCKKGQGAFEIKNGTPSSIKVNPTGSKLVISADCNDHEKLGLSSYKDTEFAYGGANKLVKIARGTAQFFPAYCRRYGVWDLLAPKLLLEEAGGNLNLIEPNNLDLKAPLLERTFLASSK